MMPFVRTVSTRWQISYDQRMEKNTDRHDMASFEAEFHAAIMEDDDTAAREILASGIPIHIARDDTPAGHVIRVHPDGREELIKVDLDAATALLGS